MKTIREEEINFNHSFGIVCLKMPVGANILTIKIKNGVMVLFAEIDTNQPLEDRYFEMFYNNQEIPVDMGVERKYITTILTSNDRIACHYYERIN